MIEYFKDGTVRLSDSLTGTELVMSASDPQAVETAIAAFFPPMEVPMWQVDQLLIGLGMKQQILDTIAALPEPQRSQVQSQYDKAPNLVRAAPAAQAVRLALGWDQATMDQLLREAIQ